MRFDDVKHGAQMEEECAAVAALQAPGADRDPRGSDGKLNRLKRLAELGLALTGDPIDVFRHIAGMIGELLDVSVVNLSEIRGDELFFLSTCVKGDVRTYTGTCKLQNTPCATVQESKDLRVYHDVITKFPEAVFLQAFNAYTYCGFPALDGNGTVAAVICVLDDQQHDFSEEDKDLLKVLAHRVGLELERQKHLDEHARKDAELQRAAQRAKEEKAKTEAIIAAIGDGISIQDTDFKVLYQNEIHMKLVGDHVGEYCYQAFEHKDERCEICPVAMTFRDGKIHTVELSGPAGSSVLHVETTASPLRDVNGGIIAGIEVVRDISHRKQAEQALANSEEKFRTLFLESKDVFYISSPQGKFLDINPAGVELFGYSSRQEMLSIDIGRDMYVDHAERNRFIDFVHRNDYAKDYPVEMKRKNGEKLSVIITSSPLRNSTGEITAFRGIIRDITEQKKLEEQLFQAQKMEAVGQLAGGVAHDFNNILAAIIGYGSILQKKIGQDDPQRKNIDQILAAADRAANLTRSLLSFSRKQNINPKPLRLNEVVMKARDFITPLIGKDIELRTVLSGRDPFVLADAGQVEQVLMNLATNARDVMPDGGTLFLKTDTVVLDEAFIKKHPYGKPGKYVLLSITDSGCGMDEQTRTRIFEPFFTTKEPGKGTGLGLAIVYGIIKQHRGYIHVYSEKEGGTTFKIYLPVIQDEVESKKESTPEQEVIGGAETILVAEDDATVRKLMVTVLRSFGYIVIEAADGAEAITRFSEHAGSIDLVLTDTIMPRKNGREAYGEMRKIRPNVPALFTSGYSKEVLRSKSVIDDDPDFILKPVTPRELLRRVREVLDRPRVGT